MLDVDLEGFYGEAGDHAGSIRDIILEIRKMLAQPVEPTGPVGFHP